MEAGMTAVRVAIYPVKSGQTEEMTRRVNESLLPIYHDQAGFQSLRVVDAGDEVASISHWDTREHAEAGGQAALDWVKQNDDLILGPPSKAVFGEEVVSA
jgi:heme-degrading monooxygenase HmoA